MAEREKKSYTQRKGVRRFFVILLSTMLMAGALFLYGLFQTATLKTIATFNGDFAERVNTISNALLNNISTSAMQMFYTSSIKTLRTSPQLSNAQKIIGFRDLGNFVSSSDFLDSVMVYNGKTDVVFTSEGSYSSAPSQDFHDMTAASILTHPEEFPYSTPIKRTSPNGTTYSFLFFEYQDTNPSALLLNVNEQWYTSQLLGISENNDYIVVDEQGHLIASENEDLHRLASSSWPELQQQMHSNPSEGFFMPSAFSGSSGWMYHRMDSTGWYYLRPIDLESIAPGLIHIRNFLFVAFLLLGGILIFFTSYLLLKFYLPLRHIRMALDQVGKSSETISAQVEELVAHQKESTLSQSLSDLHAGTLPPTFSFPILFVTACDCSADSLNHIIRMCSSDATIIPTETGATAAISSCTSAIADQLISQFTACHEGSFYVSNLCSASEDLIKSHVSLEELAKLHFLYPERQVMEERMLNECSLVSSLKTKEVSAFITAIKAGNADTSFLQWKSIVSSIQKDRYSDFCFALRYIGKQLNQLQTELGLDHLLDMDQLIENLHTIDSMHACMEQLLITISDTARLKKTQQLTVLSDQIDAYMKQHYMEGTFSAQQVAEHFQMNAAYLSRQYQQIAEKSISDAINQIRIQHACILLKSTDESAELISERVGYSNSKYFFVLFKKFMGKTPKQYRNSA